MVDERVKEIAKRYKLIRHVDQPMAKGRGKEFSNLQRCACPDVLIAPNGDVYPCGCKITKIGNILNKNFKLYTFEQECECDREVS